MDNSILRYESYKTHFVARIWYFFRIYACMTSVLSGSLCSLIILILKTLSRFSKFF
jgi:hypothetical protein